MLLRSKVKLHLGPVLVATAIVIGAVLWQRHETIVAGRTVSGSSLAGMSIGGLAAAIILFELLLWPRKWLRRCRWLIPTKYWLAFHLWLGLATGPLAIVHAGYKLGGSFTTILMCILFFVLLSGVYGWILQTWLPKWMLGNLTHETIGSQIDEVSIQSALQARQLLTAAYGKKPKGLRPLQNLDPYQEELRDRRVGSDHRLTKIVVGAPQRLGPQRLELSAEQEIDLKDSTEIWRQYALVVDPFLLHGIRFVVPHVRVKRMQLKHSPIQTRQKMIDWFSLLRKSCSPSAEPILDELERLCEQRRQFDLQRRVQNWLHGWIAFHVAASVFLGVLLVTHIVLAIRYM